VGALCVLAALEGYDPALSADLLVGTSAGSVLAAMLACGVSLEVMHERLSGSRADDVAGTGPVNPFAVTDHVHAALGKIPLPTLAPGNLSLAARTLGSPHRYTMMTMAAGFAPRGRGSLQPITHLIADVAGEQSWPTRPRTWIVAMDFDSGKRVTFGRAGARDVPLADAVTASSAAPGYFPPVVIDGRRYVDGGAVSVTNADVLLHEHLDDVLVLAPMAMFERDHPSGVVARLGRRARRLWTRRLNVEIARLAATGANVRVLTPGAEELSTMGRQRHEPGAPARGLRHRAAHGAAAADRRGSTTGRRRHRLQLDNTRSTPRNRNRERGQDRRLANVGSA
jgi:NTE family protein